MISRRASEKIILQIFNVKVSQTFYFLLLK